MKSELSYNYFISIIICCCICFCSRDKEIANKKQETECTNLVLLKYFQISPRSFTEEEREFMNQYSFSYSCSSKGKESPSCIEYYRKTPEESFLVELCPFGYEKTKGKCSKQNQIGECFLLKENGWEKVIFAQPNDKPSSMEWYCKDGILKKIPDPSEIFTILQACGMKKNS